MNQREGYQRLVRDTKNYLLYLREIGIEEIPVDKFRVQGSGFRVRHKTIDPGPQAKDKIPESEVLSLESVRKELGDCKRCKLHKGRTNIVFGVGNPKADIVFVGEGPGRDEDLQGEPFVGRAGQLLTKIIEAMGLRRQDVYICNVVKCRPPENRNPEPDEITACRPFLEKQLDVIKPKVIVALGNIALQTLLNTPAGITDKRGRFYWYREGIKVMPTYHPSYLLRNEGKKAETWEDIQMVMKELKLTLKVKGGRPRGKGK